MPLSGLRSSLLALAACCALAGPASAQESEKPPAAVETAARDALLREGERAAGTLAPGREDADRLVALAQGHPQLLGGGGLRGRVLELAVREERDRRHVV